MSLLYPCGWWNCYLNHNHSIGTTWFILTVDPKFGSFCCACSWGFSEAWFDQWMDLPWPMCMWCFCLEKACYMQLVTDVYSLGTQAIIRVTFRIPVKKSGNCQSPIYRWFSSICSEPRFERGCSNATVMITRGQGSFWSIPISRTLWVGLESVRRKACVLQRWFFTDASRTTYHTCSQFAFCRWVLQLALNISEYSFGAVTPIVYRNTLNASGLTPERTSRENVWNW